MIKKIIPRRGPAAAWTAANPVLRVGELGYETDTKKYKRGDGSTVWTALPYRDAETLIASAVGLAAMVSDALGDAISGLNLVETDDPRISGVSFINAPGGQKLIIRDQSNNIVAELEADGKWTLRLSDESTVLGTFVPTPAYGVQWGIKDASGNLLVWLDDTGDFHASNLSSAGIVEESVSATLEEVTSGPDICLWGDSLTAGTGASVTGNRWASLLASATGRTVHNRGVGGEQSWTITSRSGAIPAMAWPVSGASRTIPASGGVQIEFVAVEGKTPTPLLQGSATYWQNVTFAGVPGTITEASGVYTFTRTTAGSPVVLIMPTAVLPPALNLDRRGDITVIWIGQNNAGDDARALTDAKAIVQELTAANKRYLVMNKPTSTPSEDSVWFSNFGRRYIPIRKYMVDNGLTINGLTPTSQDSIDIAAGVVPVSLRIDGVHHNDYGHATINHAVYSRLVEFGWV